MEKMSLPKIAQRIPDESEAYEFMEELRWHGRPVCPHCGSIGEHYFLTPWKGTRETSTGKASFRRLWKCRDCREQFSVLTGTIMHGTHVPIRTWVLVIFEMVSSKNGVASREIERKYGLSPKTAWFLLHRIREGMRRDPVASLFSGVVVADETWIGGDPANKHRDRVARDDLGNMVHRTEKTPVLSLVEKRTGEVRSRVVPRVNTANLRRVIEQEVDVPHTLFHTDSASCYNEFDWRAAGHKRVDHAVGEYVRGDVSTNRLENYFSQLKRSIDGTHHHVSREHLPRYLAEFDFRYSTCDETDPARMARLMSRVAGRRLTYRPLTDLKNRH
jgi:transposase-like protein